MKFIEDCKEDWKHADKSTKITFIHSVCSLVISIIGLVVAIIVLQAKL